MPTLRYELKPTPWRRPSSVGSPRASTTPTSAAAAAQHTCSISSVSVRMHGIDSRAAGGNGGASQPASGNQTQICLSAAFCLAAHLSSSAKSSRRASCPGGRPYRRRWHCQHCRLAPDAAPAVAAALRGPCHCRCPAAGPGHAPSLSLSRWRRRRQQQLTRHFPGCGCGSSCRGLPAAAGAGPDAASAGCAAATAAAATSSPRPPLPTHRCSCHRWRWGCVHPPRCACPLHQVLAGGAVRAIRPRPAAAAAVSAAAAAAAAAPAVGGRGAGAAPGHGPATASWRCQRHLACQAAVAAAAVSAALAGLAAAISWSVGPPAPQQQTAQGPRRQAGRRWQHTLCRRRRHACTARRTAAATLTACRTLRGAGTSVLEAPGTALTWCCSSLGGPAAGR